MSLPRFLSELDTKIYESNNYLVVDLETDTSQGDFGRPLYSANRSLLACWRTAEGLVKSHWGNELEFQDLYRDIEQSDFIVAHNAIYELGWFKRGGFDISRILPFDTQLAEYVLLGNLVSGHADSGLAPVSISLDSCARRRGWQAKDPIVDLLMRNGHNPVSMPRRWLEDRCKQDVETTHALFLEQRRSLLETNRLPVLFTRCLFTPVLASIQSEGMMLDEDRVKLEYDAHVEQLALLETRLGEITGGINVNSSKQLGEFIYDKLKFAERTDGRGNPKRTATGKRATDIKTLMLLEGSTETQREFLGLLKEQSRVSAALSKSLNFMMGVCKENGGLFYADFNQTRTATHRLSSSGIPTQWGSVQFQNMARAFKRLFKAKKKGWVIGETDGSQLEFRVAAFLGQDPQAIADINNPEWDAHIESASAMASKSFESMWAAYKAGDAKTSKLRTAAKSDTFKPLFGGKSGTAKQKLWYEKFKQRYHVLESVQKSWVSQALRGSHTVITDWGMRFFFPNARMSSSGYVNVGNSVFNYPIQSLATAEIIPIAVVYLWHEIHARGLQEKIQIVNTVHDSVVCEIAPEAVEEYKQIAQECFVERVYAYLKAVYDMDFNVPLGAETKIGSHWAEEEE